MHEITRDIPSRHHASRVATPRPGIGRPCVDGKFLSAGGERLWVRGVTYGTFAPGDDGDGYGPDAQIDADMRAMAAAGINAVRCYATPPRRLLDCAAAHGIWVLVGLAWEQHVTFLDDDQTARAIEERVRAAVAECAGHPAVLAYAIGNEIPAAIVRWHGAQAIEHFLARLQRVVKATDPGALVTYVNFPSTEYLNLDFLDFSAVNVYLEHDETLEDYLYRLQSLAGERPLVLGEIGLDSRRNGDVRQARTLERQLGSAYGAGCAGTFVFSWTDEWHRGGNEILDWDFGITDRARRPKAGLAAVQRAYAHVPVRPRRAPRMSVVVCTYNGAATLDACLRGLGELDYPDYEVIVVDDGSTDRSAQIAAAHPVRLVSTPNQGLSAARNEGLAAARGEIVAYIDDDAVADPHWLSYLAAGFASGEDAAVGGPNLPPPGDSQTAACVANAPGGPVHVLLSDRVAEHIPGCNMAFRRTALQAIGGFDEQFRVAGDDVDVCWRLQAAGGRIGFHPAAVVWHHRRGSIRRYWRQQRGYGRAEAMLARKWPEKYNAGGHLTWHGRLYGRGTLAGIRPGRIYHGVWGTGAFQQRHERDPSMALELAGTPEWYLLALCLAGLGGAGALLWRPLLAALALLVLVCALSTARAVRGASRADFRTLGLGTRGRVRRRAVTALLHLVQPAARLAGRLEQGLSPWRRPALSGIAMPRRRTVHAWFEQWAAPEARLAAIERRLQATGARVARGDAYARWDLDVSAGGLGGGRLRAALEEHGAGRQQLCARIWPRLSRAAIKLASLFALLAAVAALDHAWGATTVLGALGAAVLAAGAAEAARAVHALRGATVATPHAASVARPVAIADELREAA